MQLSKTLTFDREIYDTDVLQKAAYRSMNTILVNMVDVSGKTECICSPCLTVDESAFNQAIEDFQKDVLDYQLRKKLAKETEDVRNLIIGVAFSRTGLVQ